MWWRKEKERSTSITKGGQQSKTHGMVVDELKIEKITDKLVKKRNVRKTTFMKLIKDKELTKD